MRFEGKRAVVTGGASGIGRATALRLVREGAEVWIGDIDREGGHALVAESGGRIRFVHVDVTEAEQIRALVEAAERPDILVNNAGAGGARAPIDQIEPDDWDRTHTLLLRSVALGIRYAAPIMGECGGGAIVNIASIAALQTGAAPTAYSVAKAGVLHLTHCAAADLARLKVRVNAVCPGFITTNIFTSALGMAGDVRSKANAAIEQVAAGAQPIARPGVAEDIAGAIAYLASDDAAFVTGTHIVVDGGMTIGPRHSWDANSPSLFAMLERFVPNRT